ncbi:hypothetical protein [Brockia lithotrophica]|uniref:Stage VI sporulation protein D n=1 Tax=Brockia lithotrophica TaxID=933949 RepID=A0A660L5B9_9BACL|nr:hypothetical protein [Brockia lithotrophica]RKQ89127.1 stage VI sporulation protein D [Brockia lithotrophica]
MGGERPVCEADRGSGRRQIGERMPDRGRLSFELVERIALDEPLESEAQILGAELVPDVRIEEDERHVRIVGSLRFTAEYRTSSRDPEDAGGPCGAGSGTGESPPSTRHLVYRIPLDISVPRERVTGEGLLLEIRSLEVELLGRERLLLSTVLELGGIASSPEGEVVPVVDTGYSFETTGFWPFADDSQEAKEKDPELLGDDPALAALAYSPEDVPSPSSEPPPEPEPFARPHETPSADAFSESVSEPPSPSETPSPPSPQEALLFPSGEGAPPDAFPSEETRETTEEAKEAAEGANARDEAGASGVPVEEAPPTAEAERGRPSRDTGEEGGKSATVRGQERGRTSPRKGRSVLPGWGAAQARREIPENLPPTEGELRTNEFPSSVDPTASFGSPRIGKGNFLPSQIARSRGRERAKEDSALRFVYLGRKTSAGGKGETSQAEGSSPGGSHSARREGEERR